MIKQTITTLVGAAALMTSAQAEIEFEIGAGAHSDYVWRGHKQSGKHLFDGSVAASTSAHGFNYSLGVWYGRTTDDFNFSEYDITFDISKEFGGFDFNAGGIYYGFSDDIEHTTELYFGISKTFENGVTIAGTYYHDIDSQEGAGYYESTIGYTVKTDLTDINLTAGFGYDFSDTKGFGNANNGDGITHGFFTVETPFQLSEQATLTPYVTYSNSGEAHSDASRGDHVHGGVSLAFSF